MRYLVFAAVLLLAGAAQGQVVAPFVIVPSLGPVAVRPHPIQPNRWHGSTVSGVQVGVRIVGGRVFIAAWDSFPNSGHLSAYRGSAAGGPCAEYLSQHRPTTSPLPYTRYSGSAVWAP